LNNSTMSRRDALKLLAATTAAVPFAANGLGPGKDAFSNSRIHSLTGGPYQPTWDSLNHYQCPEWIRDAKFGIWAHWTAQCVPEQGDWYARFMYMQGSPDYEYHVRHYGHPSVFGFKDIDNLWTADKWEPDELMRLYRRAGARFFLALANHHDNFDCWDSKYQEWNSTRVGPKKDIVGTWAKVARAQGLRFGVTVHASHTWEWFNVSHGSDKTGALAGVPYDGNLTMADGVGKWWEGLDPEELYCKAHPLAPGNGFASLGDPPVAYTEKFFNRTLDVIDKYRPDLLMFDDNGLPFGDYGLRIAAHFYNASIAWHGSNQAVLNTRIKDQDQIHAAMNMLERGVQDKIEPLPWETATCIGDWHYKRDIAYKSPEEVVRLLVDVVSKNGALVLNIPLRGNGTIDAAEQKFLEEMALWIEVNSEAIYGTRPWTIYGEGPTQIKPGQFNDKVAEEYTAADIRFTAKGNTLYAFALAWPGERMVIHSLALETPLTSGTVREVRLLGHEGRLSFTRDHQGLSITLPPQRPGNYVFTFKINGLEPNS
jgi:alpha-L-fucosidase